MSLRDKAYDRAFGWKVNLEVATERAVTFAKNQRNAHQEAVNNKMQEKVDQIEELN